MILRRRTFLGAAAALSLPRPLFALAPPQRGVLLALAPNADPAVAESAKSLLNAPSHPVLQALGAPPKLADSHRLLAGNVRDLAYNHLILIGPPTDPLITAAWQREARVDRDTIYTFGFGYLQGHIGYAESDRNPWLHSQSILSAPFETQLITLTGTTPAGIQLAIDAFLSQSLVNGVIAAKGWTRPRTSLLDRDPLSPTFTLPAQIPGRVADQTRLAVTQGAEDEYRGVLEDTGVLPHAIWRVKYYKPGNWDSAGFSASFDNYAAGLHRRAYGNTVWCAQFASPAQAAAAAPKIAAAAHLSKSAAGWAGPQPPYANNKYAGEQASPGTFTLSVEGDAVLLTALQTRVRSGEQADA